MESTLKGIKCFFFRNVNKSYFLKKIRFFLGPHLVCPNLLSHYDDLFVNTCAD